MAGDQVTVDPEFDPSRPGGEDDRDRRLRRIGLVMVVVAAFVVGWLLRLPTTPTGPQGEEAASSATTTAVETTAPTTTPDVPLGEVVPGFTDTITVLTWDDHSEGVVRWRASQPAPETTVLTYHDEPLWRINGLDASGRWYALRALDGVLTVYPVEAHRQKTQSAVGVEVESYVWHDTEPGRLAWMVCPLGSAASSGALYTLDVRDGEPAAMRLVEGVCESPATWLAGWGDWGMLMKRTAGADGVEEVLVDGEGTRIATGRFAPGHPYFVAGGPDRTTIWTDDPSGPEPSSFLLSPDGRERTPVPGLVADEWVDDAVWSPDGSTLALQVQRAATVIDPTLRIVEMPTGEVIAEIEEIGWVWAKAWSPDGRFFLYERWPDVVTNWAGVPQDVELVFYDTMTDARAVLPLPGYATDIRVSAPSPSAELRSLPKLFR